MYSLVLLWKKRICYSEHFDQAFWITLDEFNDEFYFELLENESMTG
jgi:hypothetical protein